MAYRDDYSASRALCVGIDDYADPAWPPLGQAEANARDLAALLSSPPYGFASTLLLGPQASRAAIEDALFELRSADPDTRLLVYFAGHGFTRLTEFRDEIGYLVCHDTPRHRDDRALKLSEVLELRANCKAKHIAFIFDSCFSGNALGLTKAASSSAELWRQRRAYQVITAGAADQTVSDFYSMTRYLLPLLQSPGGLLTIDRLGLQLKEQLTRVSKGMQIPQYGQLTGSQGGEMVLYEPPGETQLDRMPPELQADLRSENSRVRFYAVAELARLVSDPALGADALALLGAMQTDDPDQQVRRRAGEAFRAHKRGSTGRMPTDQLLAAPAPRPPAAAKPRSRLRPLYLYGVLALVALMIIMGLLMAFGPLLGQVFNVDPSPTLDPASTLAADLPADAGGTIRLKADSPTQPLVQAALAAWAQAAPDSQVETEYSSSKGSPTQMCMGQADLAISVRNPSPEDERLCSQAGIDAQQYILGYETLVIIVNPANDWVECLNGSEVSKLFSSDGLQPTDWNDADPLWADASLLYQLPEPGSPLYLNMEANLSEIAGVETTLIERDGIAYHSSEESLIAAVASQPNALGIIRYETYARLGGEVRALSIVGSDNCVIPDRDSVASGIYPLMRPLYLYIDAQQPADSAWALAELLLAQAPTLMSESGYFAFDEAFYGEMLAELRSIRP